MKTTPFILAAAVSLGLAGTALAADVTVNLTGVQDRGGNMLVSLQTRDQFMKPVGAAGAYAPATPGAMSLVVQGVPPGDYAVMVLHDADSNWTLTMKDGRPAEGLANSGEKATRGTRFDAVKITVPADGASVTLPLAYP
ncbi:MAG: DUF2141 domain-containing protein [Caulobacter sp.]|nr:DUF2141 domain-containing protein [Caulobacter sp.]